MSATPTRRVSWLRATAAVTVLSLSLTGCGGDDDAASGEGNQEQSDSAEEPDTTEPDAAGGDGEGAGDQTDGAAAGDEPSAPDSEEPPTDQGWDGTSEPAFLEAAEIPNPYDDPWSVVDTGQGPPREERFCTEGVLPAEGVWHRNFTKDTLGTAYHVVVHTADESAATALMSQLTEAIADCETRNTDQGTVEFEDHGERNIADASRSYATVFTPDAPGGIATDGIGVARDGATVTYVLATGGAELSDFPAGTFDEPLSTALSRIDS